MRATRHAGHDPVARDVLASIADFRRPDGGYVIPNAFRFTLATRP